MITLRQPLLQPWKDFSAEGGPGGAYPDRPERRQAERRSNAMAWHNRETRLRFAAQAAGFGIYDLDCASGEIHWSPELKAIAGLPQDDAVVPFERIAELVHPDDRARVMTVIRTSLDPGSSGELEDEHRLLRPDGTVRWVKVKGRTFFSGGDNRRRAIGATGVVMDVTESRAYQQELADSRARLAGLIDSTTDAILSVDPDNRIIQANPAACRMFRCTMDDVIGSSHDRFIPERLREAHRQHVQHFMESGVTARAMGQAGTFLGVRADGEEFPVEASISKVRVGGQWQMTVILRDITERKAAEEALRRSQQDLETAVRGADIGIWKWDMRTGEMPWSDRCRELFGIPPGEPMTFDLFLQALDPGDRETASATVARALEKHEEYNLEHRIRWPDGSLHWVVVVGRGHYDATGETIGMSGIALDVTERKRIEDSLRESEELLRIANEAANIGTYDIDLETGHARLSPELCAIFGVPARPGATQDDLLQLVHPDDREAMATACRKAADPAGDGYIHQEYRILRPDGNVRWMVWRGRTTFRDTPAGHRPVRNIGACFDITERKRLEEELQQMNEILERRVAERTAAMVSANEQLVRSNLELQQFAYIAAHDLQTPLRSISGFAQLLQQEYRGCISAQADVWINQLVHHVERMHDLIQDLLAYSGIDSPGRPFEPTDFRQIFDQVLDSMAAAVQESGATVTRAELPTVMGDRVQLAQVLRNLLSNAIKYRSSEPPRIHVSARRVGKEWLFSVSDNGIGIARKHQERIFEVFRRLHSQQAYPGTGIGLAICRRVVQRHGGRIWVESEPGQGSIFHFSLPAEDAPVSR